MHINYYELSILLGEQGISSDLIISKILPAVEIYNERHKWDNVFVNDDVRLAILNINEIVITTDILNNLNKYVSISDEDCQIVLANMLDYCNLDEGINWTSLNMAVEQCYQRDLIKYDIVR